MAINVNKMTLVGRLGADPEQHGSGPVKMNVATSRSWKSQSGERQEKTQWHKVVIWNTAAQNFALEYVKKGDLVYIEGEMEYRVWEKEDGEKVNLAEVIVHPYTGVLQSMQRAGQSGDYQEREDSRPTETQRRREKERSSGSTSRDFDDEIPF